MWKAKVKHGSVLIGGNADASIYKTTKELNQPLGPEEGTSIMANLNFKGGYFLIHDVALGVDLGINHESYSVSIEGGKDTFRRTYLLGGPFARYYLDNGVFGELSLKGGLLNFSTGDKTNLFVGNAGVGYAWFVNEKIAVEPMLSFRYSREWQGSEANVSLGPVIGVGIQAYLLRKTSQIIKEAL
ncbi:autotransporter outer membrane beta-barrel domain-containing protein [Pontibacter mangrovi]|uniref:Autotransporter outer membrane beta-barrel domain-containing protein n=1 Tax=Pontibacter mangrovi TaxID=2589816 RepID=A0A501WJH2_9BACT|nr:autotransporter outer membrane beta-barrel domain-containing protein [Pontibacter mangrovi]TPE45776.1 autotransporter outer membrane beta-barrel domain-containing protein [Pontibacter mangrovi]